MKYLKYIILLSLIIPQILFSQTTDFVNTQLKKAQEYIVEKNYALGLSTLNILLQENPNDSNIYRNYAELFLSLALYDDALSNIQKALFLSKENPSNYVIAGNIYRILKDYDKAKDAYATAITLAPNMGEAYSEFALLNLQHYFIDDAERLAELAYHYSPNAWQNIILKANIALISQNFSSAQKIFSDGIREFPYNEQLLDAFAQFYIANNQLDKAIVILKEGNSRFGESIFRIEFLGGISFFQENYSKALKYYEILDNTYTQLSLYRFSLLKWKLHNLYEMNNDTNKSQEFLQKAFELDPLNQLYITKFYMYLLSTDNTNLRSMLAQHLENIANQERKSGIGYYYLSLLHKIIKLTPSNNRVRKQLIDYAKIKNNEYQISLLLQQSQEQEQNNKRLSQVVSLRDHFTKTKRLDSSKRLIHQYTNKIFIKEGVHKVGTSIKQSLDDLEYFFPQVYFDVILDKNFSQESRTLFQNNTNYNIVTYVVFDQANPTFELETFDKNGIVLKKDQYLFKPELLTENIIDLIQSTAEMLPPIGYINSRQTDSSFQISLGSENNLSTNSIVAILDKDFNPLTSASVISVSPYEAIIKQLSLPSALIDIKSSFIVPIEYVPSLNTNTNNIDETTERMQIITNINQVSQKHYSQIIDFSRSNQQ